MKGSEMKFEYCTITQLIDTNCVDVPTGIGIYVVDVPQKFHVVFRDTTTAIEVYKGYNLLYPAFELQQKFERSDKNRLYIGKAAGVYGLRQRIRQLIRYGSRNGTNKRGGRAIWQIENCYSLLVGYWECENPRDEEKEALNNYVKDFGVLPVANWVI